MDRGLMLYDADCGFCTRTSAGVHRLGVRVDRAGIQHTDLDRFGIARERALREMPYVHPDGRVEYAHLAWAAILQTGPLPVRTLGRLMRVPGLERVAAWGYRWVRDHRATLGRISRA